MKYIILILWTFSLFLLMFSSFPIRVECRPTRAMGPGPPRQTQQQIPGSSNYFSNNNQHPQCPVMEGPTATRFNPWPDIYGTDITVKVWESPIVLEGTARSRSEVRADGSFGVTFDLHRVVKGDAPLLRRRKQFRIQFLDNPNPLPERVNNNNGLNNRNRNNNVFRNSTKSSQLSLKSRITLPAINDNKLNAVYNSHSNTRSGSSSSANNNGFISSPRHQSQNQQIQLYQQSRQYQPNTRQQQQSQQISNQNQFLQQSQAWDRQQQQFRQSHFSNSRQQSLALPNYPPPNPTVRVLRNATLVPPTPRSYTNINSRNINNNNNGGSRRSSRTGRNVPNTFGKVSSSPSGKCLPPKATIKTGRKYYVFAAKVENHFIAVFSPELANKRNTKALESILCKGCGQAPSVAILDKDVQAKVQERVRLRCRLRAGNPIPFLTWYKDGRPVNFTDPRFRLRTKRRQSILVIRKARESDIGVYRCEGKNVFGSAYASVRLSLVPSGPTVRPVNKPSSSKPVGTTPTTLWPLESTQCPYNSYCLNGGTCSYYATIGEYVCQCAEGYKGQRCDTKDIPPSSSMYHSYFCIFGSSNPDYPC